MSRRRHIVGLEARTAARFEGAPTAAKIRRFRDSSTPPGPGARSTASSPEWKPEATAPKAASSSPTRTHLAADRTSSPKAHGGGTATVAIFPAGYTSLAGVDISNIPVAIAANTETSTGTLDPLASTIALSVPASLVPPSYDFW